MDAPTDNHDTRLKEALELYDQRHSHTKHRGDPELDTRFFNAVLKYLLAVTTDHWWCSPQILPLARESLWLFSMADLPSILKYKAKLNDLLQQCSRCVQGYYVSKHIIRKRYLDIYTPAQVNRLFNIMEEFDQSRLNTCLTTSTTQWTDQQCCAITELICFPYYLSLHPERFDELFNTMETTEQFPTLAPHQAKNISPLIFHRNRSVRSWASHLADKFADDDPTHTSLDQETIDSLLAVTRTVLSYFDQPSRDDNTFELHIPKYTNNNTPTFNIPTTQNSNNIWKGVRHILSLLPGTALETLVTTLSTTSSTTMFDLLTHQLQCTPSNIHISGLLKTMALLWERLQDRFWGKEMLATDIKTYDTLLKQICDHQEFRTWTKVAQNSDDEKTTTGSDKKLLRHIHDMVDWIFPFWHSLCKIDGADYITDKVLDTLLLYFQLPTWKWLFRVHAAIVAFRIIQHSITKNTGLPIENLNRFAHVWVPFAMNDISEDDDKSTLVSTRQDAREAATSILTDLLCQDSRSLRDAYITLAMSSSSPTLHGASTIDSDQQGILSSAYPKIWEYLQAQPSTSTANILSTLLSAYAPLASIDTIQQQSIAADKPLNPRQTLLLGRMKALRELVSEALKHQNNVPWKARKAVMRGPSIEIPLVSILAFSTATLRNMISTFMTRKRSKQTGSNSSAPPPSNWADSPLQFLFDHQPQATMAAITHILTDFLELCNVHAEMHHVATSLGQVLQSVTYFLMDNESGYLSGLVKTDENDNEEQMIMEYWNSFWQVTGIVIVNSYQLSKTHNMDDVLDMVILWMDIATQTAGCCDLFQQPLCNDSLDMDTLVSTVDGLSYWIDATQRSLLEKLVPLLNTLLLLLELAGIKISSDAYDRLSPAAMGGAATMLKPDEKRNISSALRAHTSAEVIFMDDSDDEYMEWEALPTGNSASAMGSSNTNATSHTTTKTTSTRNSHSQTSGTGSKINGLNKTNNTTTPATIISIDEDDFFDDWDDNEPPAEQNEAPSESILPASHPGNKRNRTQHVDTSHGTTSTSSNKITAQSGQHWEQKGSTIYIVDSDSESDNDDDNGSDSGLSGLVDNVNKKRKLDQQKQLLDEQSALFDTDQARQRTKRFNSVDTKPINSVDTKPINSLDTKPINSVNTKPIISVNNKQSNFRDRQAEYERKMKRDPNIDQLYKTIFSWSLENIKSDTPPHISSVQALHHVQDTYTDYQDYYDMFEPLLLLEIWSKFIQAKDTLAASNVMDWFTMKSRRYVKDFVDVTFNVPLDVKVNLGLDDLVCLANHFGPDFFFTRMIRGAAMAASELRKGHQWHDKAFLGKVVAISNGNGNGDIIIRCYFPPERINILNSLAVASVWKCIKVTSLGAIQREYAAILGLQHYELANDLLHPHPPRLPVLCPKAVEDCTVKYNINKTQAEAIVGAVNKRKGFTLIQGPPGTGKTKTIIALIDQLLEQQKQQRTEKPGRGKILVCAPSNAAVDEIAKRLKNGISTTEGLMKPKVVRIGVLDSVNISVKDLMLEHQVNQLIDPSSTSDWNNNNNDDVAEDDNDHDKSNNNDSSSSSKDLSTQHDEIRETIRSLRLELQEVGRNLYDSTNTKNAISEFFDRKKDLERQLERQQSMFKETNRLLREHIDNLKIRRHHAKESILQNCDIVCATLNGSGHPVLFETNMVFDTVIVDEAAQAVEVSTLIPLKYDCKRCILVGDPNQLPPTVLSQIATRFDYEQSLFVRLEKNAPDNVYVLRIQYRMHPDISALPSELFYKAKLLDGPNMAEKAAAVWHQDRHFRPYMFFDVVDGAEQQGQGTSLYNVSEADVAVALVDKLASDFPSVKLAHRIGIITPYKEQVSLLKSQFERYFGSKICDVIDFNTVDGFQGQEKDIIIFSCVRSGNENRNSIGFLSDVRRMNVGLTRAKRSLFVLGNARTLRVHQFWGKLVENAGYRWALHVCQRPYFGRRLVPNGCPKNVFEGEGDMGQKSHLRWDDHGTSIATTHSTTTKSTKRLALTSPGWQAQPSTSNTRSTYSRPNIYVRSQQKRNNAFKSRNRFG